MHKLTVTLKQHTPLIHFQHDQEGATLRASEVKPKLDKFIVERCFHNNFEECRQYLVGYNPDRPDALRDKFNDAERPYRALDYKMRIVAYKTQIINIGSQYPSSNNSLLQLNIGKRQEDFTMMSFSDSLEISFLSNMVDIDNLMTEYNLSHFFFYNNFGNRTSKGFGSFTMEKYNGRTVDYPSEDSHWNYAQFDILPLEGNERIKKNQAYKTIFAAIQKSWKALKRFQDCRGNRLTNVLLNVSKNGECQRNYERVPSPLFFKPIIYKKEDDSWELDIIVGLNDDVIKNVYGNNSVFAKQKFGEIVTSICNEVNFEEFEEIELENNRITNISI